MVHNKKQPTKYSFDQMNKDLNDLYYYLKSSNYNESEIKTVFNPIISNLNLNHHHQLKRKIVYFLLLLLLIVSIYFLSYTETFSWHISAISRIALIKILPYWDWTHLKNQQCIIAKQIEVEANFNCNLCENVDQIDVYETLNEESLIREYIEVDRPIILTSSMDPPWPKNTSKFIEELLKDEVVATSYPCALSTNTLKRPKPLNLLLSTPKHFQKFFLHFQNCELEPMKHFRTFVYRPKFLPRIYSPVVYNWLIWNRNYNHSGFKRVDLVEKVTVVGEVAGEMRLRLSPRKNCAGSCSILEFVLKEGEMLLFTSLWDLEYQPGGEGEAMAIVLETRD